MPKKKARKPAAKKTMIRIRVLALEKVAKKLGLWETVVMPKKRIARQNEERKANELIVKVKKQKAAKALREDPSQDAARMVKETTEQK